jgi:hypothetical protein
MLIERGHIGKLIVLFPEVHNIKRLRDREMRKPWVNAAVRLDHLRKAFLGTDWESALQAIDDALMVRAIVFFPGGATTVIVDKSKNRNTYQAAAVIAHYMLCHTSIQHR